jgi:glutathione peroxidase
MRCSQSVDEENPMKKQISLLAGAMVVLSGAMLFKTIAADNSMKQPEAKTSAQKEVPAVLNFKMKSLDGKDVDLSKYQGKVVLMVNVASHCGNTPQYKDLEALHEKYAGQGLAILGFPSNDFGAQEPGTSEEIASFCQKNYGVKFDMFSKVKVKGDDKCELYQYLTSDKTNPKFPGEIHWNFEKFLIGRDGHIAARFAPGVKPNTDEVVKSIESELAKKA